VGGVLDERALDRRLPLPGKRLRRRDGTDALGLPDALLRGFARRDDNRCERLFEYLVGDPPTLSPFEEHVSTRRSSQRVPGVQPGLCAAEVGPELRRRHRDRRLREDVSAAGGERGLIVEGQVTERLDLRGHLAPALPAAIVQFPRAVRRERQVGEGLLGHAPPWSRFSG